jgi:hypothetical protein
VQQSPLSSQPGWIQFQSGLPDMMHDISLTHAQLHQTLHSVCDFIKAQSAAIVSLELAAASAVSERASMRVTIDSLTVRARTKDAPAS